MSAATPAGFTQVPDDVQPDNALDLPSVTSRIAQLEGTGQNPRSTARGVSQFTDATWLGTYRRHANAQGMSDQQVLAQRDDPATARAMLNNLAQDNANGLAGQGHPVTPGTIYLASGFGLGGAHAILSANPNTPIDRVVGPGVMQANPNLAGMTAGQVAAQFDRKMAGGGDASRTSDYASGLQRLATPAEARAFNDAHRKELARLLHTRGAARQAGTQSAQLAAALIGNRQHGSKGDPALVAALKKLPVQSDGKRKALAAALVAAGR